MSWVYFIRYSDQLKIGTAKFPRQRFYALQGGSPVPLEFLGVIPGDRATEQALHRRWASHRKTQPKRTEWFTAAPEIMAFVHEHARPPPPRRRSECDMRLSENRVRN